jgi:lysine biosynthesis protein LysW
MPCEAIGEDQSRARTQNMTRCPECESDLELDDYELDVGETINCPECAVELKVLTGDPITVALVEGG